MKLDDKDKMTGVALAYDNDEVVLLTREGYALRYSVNEIPQVGVKAKGVRAVKLTGDDELVSLSIINRKQTELVVVTDKSGTKRLKLSDVQVTNRATKGMLIAKKNKTNPHAVRYGIACSLNDDLPLINKEGLMNVKAKDISLLGKDSRFSNPLTNREFYRITGIEEVRIVDIPENVPTKKSFEEISLEGLEYEE